MEHEKQNKVCGTGKRDMVKAPLANIGNADHLLIAL